MGDQDRDPAFTLTDDRDDGPRRDGRQFLRQFRHRRYLVGTGVLPERYYKASRVGFVPDDRTLIGVG